MVMIVCLGIQPLGTRRASWYLLRELEEIQRVLVTSRQDNGHVPAHGGHVAGNPRWLTWSVREGSRPLRAARAHVSVVTQSTTSVNATHVQHT